MGTWINDFGTAVWNRVGENTGLFDIQKGFEKSDLDLIAQGAGKLTKGPRPYLDDGNDLNAKFARSNTSYSGADCTIIAQVNYKLIVLGNVETFSYSIFREKGPVRVLGRSHAKGYTSGGRTISGSIVFAVFNVHPLNDILKEIKYNQNPSDRNSSPVADQLPPIDFILLFRNEYGNQSLIRLYGVEFLQEGQVHSINDIYSENTMNYVCRDMDVMIDYDDVQNFKDSLFERQLQGLFVDNYIRSMLDYKKMVELKISEAENMIITIRTEYGRRAITGFFTLGISELLNYAFTKEKKDGNDLRTKADFDTAIKKWEKIQAVYETELTKINAEIQAYESNMRGWNAQRGQDGLEQSDNMRQAVVN